jgi:alpha-mannosidase
MKDKQLYMIGNAHLDPVWLWQWQEGFQEAKATFRSALDRMKEYDDFVFTSSSAAMYEWVERSDPAMFEEIRQRVKEGRWVIVGGWWIQPDCNIPGGESFVRQGLYGQRYFKEKFGVIAKVGYNVDSFGHNGMLPQILKKSGMDYYVMMRPMPNEKGLPGRLFRWRSDDGSEVLTFRIMYEYLSWGKDLENHVRRVLGEFREPLNDLMFFYGVGNHGGGPTKENIESIRRLNGREDLPKLVFAAPDRYFRDMENKGPGIKQWNRRAENKLIAAEKFSALAYWLTGQPYPAAELKQAWKSVLFNQFHDILAGTSIEPAYDDALYLYGEAMAIGDRVLNYAIQSLSWRIGIEQDESMLPIVVFNPHAWASRVNVELEVGGIKPNAVLLDDQGRPVPFQTVKSLAAARGRFRLSFMADLPPMGYRVYKLVKESESIRPVGETLAFVLGGGENPYLLPERNVTLALRHLNGQTLPRNAKVYPEILDYLGWCSWDAFYHEVDEKGLLAKAEELQRLGLPVRWVMIDDGWSEVRDRKLYGMDADPEKFPRGLAHVIEALKRRFGIRWVGVWHTIAGYWDGIHPDSEMARELREYLFTTRRGNVMPYPDAGRGFGFWHAWHGYLARQGVDFVKVDSQSAVHNFLRHHLPVGQAASAAHTALEASAALHFDRTIINCMGMSAENIWHRPVSAVSRNSDDFVPQERHGFREHSLQNAYNSYYHGAWYWGDWDMFWTENHDDVQNMVLRAVSGGPVYFSDALGGTDPARVRPLIFRDGKIIRCDRTANPTPDCLTRSPLAEPVPLKLWNKAGRAGVVAAFHICEAQTDVQGAISLDDVPDMTADSAWVYAHFSRTAVRLARGQSLPFALKEEECKLFLIVPAGGAVTPIGLADKLVSSAAVERQWEEGKSRMVRLREGGLFVFAADQPPSAVRANGETLKWSPSACPSLYEADCSHLHGAVTLEIVRA